MAIAATGCSGSGSSSSAMTPAVTPVNGAPTTGYPVAPPGTTTTPSSHATAKFTIKVPASLLKSTASKARHPQYVSTYTQSIQIAMTSLNGTDYTSTLPVLANLAPGAPGCVPPTGPATADSGLVCTVAFPTLPVGADGFTLTTYSAPIAGTAVAPAAPAAATALSTNKVSGTILVGQTTDIPVTLAGIIGSVTVSLDQNTTADATWLTPGTPVNDKTIVVTAFDVAGGQIIGAAPYQVQNGNLGAGVNGVTAPDSIDISDNDIQVPTNATTLKVEPSTVDNNSNGGSVGSNPTTLSSTLLGNLSAPNSAVGYNYTGQGLPDTLDVITVTDHLKHSLTDSIPVRVNASGLILANANPTPLDALLSDVAIVPATPSAPELAFPAHNAPTNTYYVSAGNDSVINATIQEAGWGTVANPFFTSDSCTGETVTLGTAPNALTTGTVPTTVTIAGTSAQAAQTDCVITIGDGGSDLDTFHLNLTGTANGGNFQVQSVHNK